MAFYMVIQAIVTVIYGCILRFVSPIYTNIYKGDHFQWETSTLILLASGRIYGILIFSFVFLLFYFVLNDYSNVIISFSFSVNPLLAGLVAIDLLTFPIIYMTRRIKVGTSILILSPWVFVVNCMALFLAAQ
jgi:hypothetical protein